MEDQFFVKTKIISQAVLEGRWYIGKKIRQIWAESAVPVDSYLQNCLRNDFCFHKKLTFHSCTLNQCGSFCWFTHYTLLPSGDRCVRRRGNWSPIGGFSVWIFFSLVLFDKSEYFWTNFDKMSKECLSKKMQFFIFTWTFQKQIPNAM